VAERPIALPPVRQVARSAVLSTLSEQVTYCFRRAGECRELAELATSPSDKTFYIEREQSWLVLARSYELQDRTGLFVKEVYRSPQRRSEPAPTCPGCAAPTMVCWSTIFVCTNCRRVVEEDLGLMKPKPSPP
jgi:hypothetical protein